ncbi:CaiB/BaiF CoA-transferase family protein [Bradyrhizobium sp. CW1]|uniref:CaiB/BaiF CoA transferase family protein n=1 Tax=Bradyrhizobium sp. CW1 TaxID=2782686 RepID=UPI002000176C|nr:CaiB/BaiF CoA-transferase family protein [Bradyrhizobium sp. CW1]UPJ26401.1 CoA transferase [Bradyrhizobium sp. CW1]
MIAEQAAGNPEATQDQSAKDPARRPLQGIRVVDLTHVLAGPLCTTIMADLGADVVKVERLGAGDVSRQVDPFRDEESYYFAALNRNKRSLALDLKRDEGRLALEKLVQRADVLVENFRPGTLDSLGFGYERLLQLNPGLVICSISGFGQTGPLRDYKAFDLVAQAMTGLMSLTREPGRPPLRILVGDILTGVYGALSVASALVGRVKTGKGCVIDLSLFESLLTTFPYFAGRYLADGELPPPVDAGPNAVPYDVFPASDGELVIAVYGDHMWPSLCSVLELPELAADAELKTNAGRVKRSKEVETALVERLKAKTVAQWCEKLATAGIPHAPILNIGAALEHPHTRARGMIVEFEHQKCGTVKAVGSAIHINGAPVPGSATPGPTLGEHTEQVLAELGYSSAGIARLRQEGAIGS